MKRQHECPSCPTGWSTKTHDAAGVPELLTCGYCGHMWHAPRTLEVVKRSASPRHDHFGSDGSCPGCA